MFNSNRVNSLAKLYKALKDEKDAASRDKIKVRIGVLKPKMSQIEISHAVAKAAR